MFFKKNKGKIFGIGFNKTGTTSLLKAMKDLQYDVAPQRPAELMLKDYAKRDFSALVEFCKKHEFFQDVPFSYYYTFIVLDQQFPGSKFILTVRDNPQQWYSSLVSFHAKKFGQNGQPATAKDLKEATYRYKGFAWEARQIAFDVTEEDPYPREKLIHMYQNHIDLVKDYFRYKPDQLLVINLSEKGAYQKLCHFLGKKPAYENMPWENKT